MNIQHEYSEKQYDMDRVLRLGKGTGLLMRHLWAADQGHELPCIGHLRRKPT